MAELTRRKAIGIEAMAVGAILVPDLVLRLAHLRIHSPPPTAAREFVSTCAYLAPICVLLFIIRFSGDPAETFGIQTKVWWRIPGRVVLLHLLILSRLFESAYVYRDVPLHSGPFPRPSNLEMIVACVERVAAAGYIQLFLFGYLLPRIEELIGSTRWAIVLTAILFALGSQSITGLRSAEYALLALAQGLCFAGAFTLYRSIWPQVISMSIYSISVYFIFVELSTR